ncbi:MAG: hypothetical protein LBU12_03640 [Deltaproteobacteria bacterium]|nr:hypothetical protein [Deltaproteobacteria bacterium]
MLFLAMFWLGLPACQESASTAPSAGDAQTSSQSADAPQKNNLAAASAPSPSDELSTAVQSAPTAAPGTGLKILNFLPDGQAQKFSQLVVMFNQPMVALGDYANVDQDLMILEPPLPGRLRWLNQYVLAFLPDKPLTGSLVLKAQLKAGLRALSGDVLEEGSSVTVTLPSVAVKNSYLSGSITAETLKRPLWLISFNQKINLDSLKAKSRYVCTDQQGQKSETPAEFPADDEIDRLNQRYAQFDVLTAPVQDLPREADCALVIDAGLISLDGPTATSEAIKAFSFRSHGPLLVSHRGLEERGSQLVLDPPDSWFSLNFSNPVVLAELVDHLESEPPLAALTELKRRLEAERAAERHDGAEKSGDETEGAEGSYSDDSHENYYGAFSEARTSISFHEPLQGGADYRLTLKPGLTDILGQSLGEEKRLVFSAAPYAPRAWLDDGHGLFETGTAPKTVIKTVNLPEIKVLGYALEPRQAMELLRLSGADFEFGNWTPNAVEVLKFLKSSVQPKTLILKPPKSSMTMPTTLPLDLAELFGPDLIGKFLVTVLESQEASFTMHQVSDLGLTAKIGSDSSTAWVTDLSSGRGLAGAEVELFSTSGRSLFKTVTGADGLAPLPGGLELNELVAEYGGRPQEELGDSSMSLNVVARAAGQMTLWNVAWNDGFSPWRVELDGQWRWPLDARRSASWLLTAQPIYKPGETLRLKIISRQESGDELVDLPSKRVSVVLADPDYSIIAQRTVDVSAFGTFSFDYELPSQAKTGDYTVYLAPDPNVELEIAGRLAYEIDELEWIGYLSVQHFRAPAFDLTFQKLPEAVYDGQKVAVSAEARYHFGAPVTEQPGAYEVGVVWASGFSLPGLGGFSVVNDLAKLVDGEEDEDYWPAAQTLASGAAKLDREGRLTFEFVAEPDRRPKPRLLLINIGAQDVDGREIHRRQELLVHPAAVYPALKLRSFLNRSGQPMAVDLTAASPDGQLVQADVELTLYRRSWNTVRRKGPGSAFLYSSKASDQEILKLSQPVNKDVAPVELTPPAPGFYWLKAELKDSEGRRNEAAVSFYATGDGAVGWRYSNDELVALVADKPAYEPGDVAKILVQSPFASGQALVTVERSGVRSSQVVDVVDHSPVFEVPLTAADAPNVFVSVILSRGRIAEKPDENNVDLGKPAIRKGYVTLNVPLDLDVLKVEVKPQAQQYRPGQEAAVDFQVFDRDGTTPFAQAEVALVVVDASVVQVGGEDTYFPNTLFSQLRPLAVLTANPISALVGRRNWAEKGASEAGGGGEPFDSQAALALRSNFKNLAHFVPAAALDDQGRGSASFKLPDNLTTFKIFAVATGHGRRSGTGQGQLLVTKDLLLRSSLPAYAGLGDRFLASVVVSNRSQNAGRAKVTFKAQGLRSLDGQLTREIELSPGESKEVGFPVAAETLGQAETTYWVEMGDETDQVLWRLPVLPVNRQTSQASYLQIGPGLSTTVLAPPEGRDPNRGGLFVELSPSLASTLTASFEWLANYRHQCVEQTTSMAYSSLLWLRLKDRYRPDPERETRSRAQVQRHIAFLQSIQTNGGFPIWPDSDSYKRRFSPTVTAYVLDFLLSARQDGFEIEPTAITSATNFLLNFLSNPEDELFRHIDQRPSTSIYVNSVLARTNYVQIIYLEPHLAQAHALPTADLLNLTLAAAYLPKSNARSQMLLQLLPLVLNRFDVSAGRVRITGDRAPWLWLDEDKLTALALLTLTQASPHNELMPGLARELVDRTKGGHFSTTQSNIYGLLALSAYLELTEPENPTLEASVRLSAPEDGDQAGARPKTASNGPATEREIISASFKSFRDRAVSFELPMTELDGADAVNFDLAGQGQLWASIRLASAPLEPDLTPEISTSLMLSRSYAVVRPTEEKPGRVIFSRGQVVRVTVTMMNAEDRRNLVLEDRVPAGFETVNFTLLDQDQTLIPLTDQDDDWDFPRNNWYQRQEFRPESVAVYADFVPAGVYTLSYLVRPVTPGRYPTPGPQAEEMYAPETFGRGAGQVLTVDSDHNWSDADQSVREAEQD